MGDECDVPLDKYAPCYDRHHRGLRQANDLRGDPVSTWEERDDFFEKIRRGRIAPVYFFFEEKDKAQLWDQLWESVPGRVLYSYVRETYWTTENCDSSAVLEVCRYTI